MSSNDNRFLPTGDQSWDVLAYDGLAEHSSSQDVTDSSIGRLPHLLEFEFFDTSLVRSNGGTLDTNIVFLDGLCTFNSNCSIEEKTNENHTYSSHQTRLTLLLHSIEMWCHTRFHLLPTSIVCFVTIFHSKIVTFNVQFNKREDQLLLDQLPDDSASR